MIGTTRSRVSFFMNKFRKLGFISYNGKIHVHNSLLNAVLHDKPALRTDDCVCNLLNFRPHLIFANPLNYYFSVTGQN